MLPARRRPTYLTSLPTPTSFDAGSAKKAASMLVKSAERGILRKHGKALASLVASKVKDLDLNQPLHSGCYTEDEMLMMMMMRMLMMLTTVTMVIMVMMVRMVMMMLMTLLMVVLMMMMMMMI